MNIFVLFLNIAACLILVWCVALNVLVWFANKSVAIPLYSVNAKAYGWGALALCWLVAVAVS